jgi:hypothetical protein
MTNSIFQKKEKQELVVRFFVLSIITLFLAVIMPPSFDFSSPERTVKEKENYSIIIEVLDKLNLSNFGSFTLIPPLETSPGRSNPFLEGAEEPGEEIIIEEEPSLVDEEIETQ